MTASGQRLFPGTAVARATFALAVLLGMAFGATAQEDVSQVYLSKAEALDYVFPTATRVVELRHILSRDETARIEKLTRKPLAEGGFYLYAALSDGVPVGYAAIVAEVGKVKPITHIVGMTPQGTVDRVAVMIYRESHGADIAGERFMRQYRGMSLQDPIRVDKDVINIAGSTLSAHAICRGVKKALAAVQAVFIDRAPSELDELLAGGADMRGAAPVTLPRGLLAPGHALVERRVMGTLCRIEAHSTDGSPNDAALLAALDEALDEVERWDSVLSDWRADTPLSKLNSGPAGAPVTVTPELMDWLVESRGWVSATDGAFDPTVGALVAAWGLRTQAPARPAPQQLAAARANTGFDLLALAPDERTVKRVDPGVVLDPGASGKGWALDRAAAVLERHGVHRALLSFRSTLLALDAPPGQDGWAVPVVHDGPGRTVTEIDLVHGALSVSSAGASSFDDGEIARGHVIDPKSGVPIEAGRLAWVRHASAAAADALSTALLVRGPGLRAVSSATGAWLAAPDSEPVRWPGTP
jgi:thiamine biosynthesis lipoprotein